MNRLLRQKSCPVVFQTGFRVFFLGAAGYAVVAMGFWYFFYAAGGNIFVVMPLTVWHGHEMIFGFVMAAVAGFLLTAVTNWTGQKTLSGAPLGALFLLWLSARVLALLPGLRSIWPLAACNLAFMLFLFGAVLRPILVVRQWRQFAVLSKLILIFASAVVFYAAFAEGNLIHERRAVRFAVYMLMSLIFTIGRRVLPFFTERGVGYPVHLRNSKTLDIASLILLVVFSVLDIFWPARVVIATLSATLAAVHALRLAGWYTPGIWRKPLLWILFAGYFSLILGFVFKTFTVITDRPDDMALHAWASGGIGLFILGMMARVSLGHTARSVAEPPRLVTPMFLMICASAALRVMFSWIDAPYGVLALGVSQILWIGAFAMFLVQYGRILILPRADGKPG